MNDKINSTNFQAGRRRIAVVDDHPVVLEGLEQLINREDDLIVCVKAGNGKEVLKTICEQQIDLVIVDMLLENTTGVQITIDLKSRYPNLYVLILSMSDDPYHVKRAFQAGARGYITKDEVSEGIITAIRRVLRGKIYVGKRIARQFSRKTIVSWTLEADTESQPQGDPNKEII
ncbi:MAG: response regulator transcription factor [Deltaproteobacteria bacterium]|nr:response regulator transcription factor [Deltaproteobacteria bacterium]